MSIRKHKKKKGGKEYVYLNANYELWGKIRQKYIRKDLESSVERL